MCFHLKRYVFNLSLIGLLSNDELNGMSVNFHLHKNLAYVTWVIKSSQYAYQYLIKINFYGLLREEKTFGENLFFYGILNCVYNAKMNYLKQDVPFFPFLPATFV